MGKNRTRKKPAEDRERRSAAVTVADPPRPRLKSADEIARSNRTDIYLAVVAPVGIRRESFEAAMQRVLGKFGYAIELVRFSGLIQDFRGFEVDKSSENARLSSAMDAGTRLRETVGPDALARAALLDVAERRAARTDPKPVAYVFWSLKHPEEAATLRLVYGGAFHLVGLFASEEDRVAEMNQRPGIEEGDAPGHIARDHEEPGKKKGQQTRDTFHRSDVFLAWGLEPDEGALERFVDLLFGRPDLTPTADEHRMFLAYANAVRSGELSRQVGATLVSAEDDVLALGANDVPRRRCGLYWPGPGDDRDAVRGEDWNIRMRRELLESVAKDIGAENPKELATKLEQTKLKNITEYGRAVHAEMEALLACARSGRSTRGSTLYVTTYPCHNCARHIIAAGVERVVYVEPYPKSLALAFHDKDIVEVPPASLAKGDDRVRFEPYLGVGPRRFLDYFSMQLGDGYALRRKREDGKGHDGELVEWIRAAAAPRVQAPRVTIEDMEKSLGGELVDFRVQAK